MNRNINNMLDILVPKYYLGIDSDFNAYQFNTYTDASRSNCAIIISIHGDGVHWIEYFNEEYDEVDPSSERRHRNNVIDDRAIPLSSINHIMRVYDVFTRKEANVPIPDMKSNSKPNY